MKTGPHPVFMLSPGTGPTSELNRELLTPHAGLHLHLIRRVEHHSVHAQQQKASSDAGDECPDTIIPSSIDG